jgi:hypothetical protein
LPGDACSHDEEAAAVADQRCLEPVLIAVGAILRYAVTVDAVAGIDLDTAGLILMLVGAVGFVLGLFLLTRSPSAGAPGPPPVA